METCDGCGKLVHTRSINSELSCCPGCGNSFCENCIDEKGFCKICSEKLNLPQIEENICRRVAESTIIVARSLTIKGIHVDVNIHGELIVISTPDGYLIVIDGHTGDQVLNYSLLDLNELWVNGVLVEL